MLDSKQREAQLLQARERLARAFARLEAMIGELPDRIRLLELSRDKSQMRIREIEELLDRERAITAQRQSLSEGTAEEMQVLSQKFEKLEKHLAERDKRISELENELDRRNNELTSYEKSHIDSLEREQRYTDSIQRLETENSGIERQLELMKEERESLQKRLETVEQRDSSYALMFTQDERLNLLKVVDTLIERVDSLTHVESTR
ncbi:MAG: hypothetical protein Q8896_00095 [Bacteroidota bacterium]|nr:hypothetical protein [Bacteroidota bacterium]